jgi:SAM-dependent methyltransferase
MARENVDCLLCGHPERRVRFRGRDLLLETPGGFTLVECARCGFMYLSPRPSRDCLPRYYPEDYLSFRPAWYAEPSPLRRLDRLFGLWKRCAFVRRGFGPGRLGRVLDVGCGTGDFLAGMRMFHGADVRGLEPSGAAAARARAWYRLEVDEFYLDEAEYAPASFDAVTLWDVLEHLPGPLDALRRVRGWLRPGGIVVLGLPDRDSADARVFGRFWAGLDVPRHFSVFSRRHVQRAVRAVGFEPPRIVNLNGGYHSFALSVRFWARGGSAPDLIRRALPDLVESFPFRAFSWPYFEGLARLHRGATMVVVARKPTELPSEGGR